MTALRGSGILARAVGPVLTALLLAPLQVQATPLNVDALHLIFDESFHDLSVSAHGPGTTWTAHTPWGGDFGDATFVDHRPGFPFSKAGGVFQIEMRKNSAGHWESGLLSTVGQDGQGFRLQYGYFEMRAKLPAGPGVWPSFWLNAPSPPTSQDPSIEVDVFEHYGKFPGAYNATVTVWPKDKAQKARSTMKVVRVAPGSLSASFHNYGVKIDPDLIVFYLDRHETWRVQTPPEHRY